MTTHDTIVVEVREIGSLTKVAKGKGSKMANLAPVSLEDIPDIQRQGKAVKLIEEFIESGLDAALVEDHTKSFGVSLKRVVKTRNLPVAVVGRGGNLYLKRTDGEDVSEDENE